MTPSPLISIIIPAYNAEKYIAETIRSAQSQTWKNIEIIVVNDGSTDNTGSVVSSFLHDPRVKLLIQKNSGCSGAKNTGLQAAQGSYIQYLDADDLLSPDKIEEQLKLINDDPLKVAICRTKIFKFSVEEPDLPEIDTEMLFDSSQPFEFLLNLYGINGVFGMIQPNAFLISRKLADMAGLWDASLSPSPDEDGEYFCRVILKASSICFEPKGVNYYRKIGASSGSLSNIHSRAHALGAFKSLQLKAAHLLAVEDSRRVKELIARHYSIYVYMYFHYKDLWLKAEHEVKCMGLHLMPVAGGKTMQLLAKAIGMKQALWIRKRMTRLVKPGLSVSR